MKPLNRISDLKVLFALLFALAALAPIHIGGLTPAILPGPSAAFAHDDHDHDDHDDDDDDDDHEDEEEDYEEHFMVELEVFTMLLDLIDDYAEIVKDPESAGVAAVMGVKEHVEEPEYAIDFFEDVLPEVKNDAVERAIRLNLVDLYAETDQPKKALQQIKILILGSE